MISDPLSSTIDKKYRLVRKLGQGGMGEVYEAVHLGTTRPVAIKLVNPQFMKDRHYIERFRREAQACGRLRHPNIVNVTDFGFASINGQNSAYLVMELLHGETLGTLLKREPKPSHVFVIDVIEQICLGLQAAHDSGVVHRDLKPENIWLEPTGRGGYTVKLLDFGLARLHEQTGQNSISASPEVMADSQSAEKLHSNTPEEIPQPDASAEMTGISDTSKELPFVTASMTVEAFRSEGIDKMSTDTPEEALTTERSDNTFYQEPPSSTYSFDAASVQLTQAGSIIGSPVYMSPEQCRGEYATEKSDIYSLGIIVYQMVSGVPPFSGSAREIIEAQKHKNPKALIEHHREIPPESIELIMNALEKDPHARPWSAETFARAFRSRMETVGSLFAESLILATSHYSSLMLVSVRNFRGMISLALFFPFIALCVAAFPSFPVLVLEYTYHFWLFCIISAFLLNDVEILPLLLHLRRYPEKQFDPQPLFQLFRLTTWKTTFQIMRNVYRNLYMTRFMKKNIIKLVIVLAMFSFMVGFVPGVLGKFFMQIESLKLYFLLFISLFMPFISYLLLHLAIFFNVLDGLLYIKSYQAQGKLLQSMEDILSEKRTSHTTLPHNPKKRRKS